MENPNVGGGPGVLKVRGPDYQQEGAPGGGEGDKAAEDSIYPEWFLGRQEMDTRDNKLSIGYEQITAINLMAQLGDVQKKQKTFNGQREDLQERQRKLKEELAIFEVKKEFKEGELQKQLEIQKNIQRIQEMQDSSKEKRDKIDSEIEKSKERLDLAFEMAVGAGQDNVLSVAEMVSRFSEPSPYQAQREQGYFSQADKALINLARYNRQEIPEVVLPFFRRLDGALTQQHGMLNVLLAAGAAAPAYYDAIRHAGESLINRGRFHASFDDVGKALETENPGVLSTLTKEHLSHIEGTFAENEPRKEQIRMTDECRAIINATSAVAQEDIVDGCYLRVLTNEERYEGKNLLFMKPKEVNLEKSTMPTELSKQQILFIKYYFGSKNKDNWVEYSAKGWDGKDRTINTPKDIKLWYTDSDRGSVRHEWLARMVALLEHKKDEKDEVGLWYKLNKMSDDDILAIVIDLNKDVTKIIASRNDKVENSAFKRGAARVAIRSWIEKDKAFMVAGRIGWKFRYKEIRGKIERFKAGGGIYKAHDVYSLMYPFDKYLDYKQTLKSTTQFFIASSNAMRKEKYKHRPGWMPNLQEGLDKDPRMKKIWSFLIEPKYKELRAKMLAGKVKNEEEQSKNLEEALKVADLDPEILKHIKKSTYAYETAYKNKDGKHIVLPMSIPAELEYLNLWHMVRDESGESIYEKWQRGIKSSEIDYSQFNFEAIDRMWVNGNMLVRLAKFWIDPYEAERDPVLAGFFKDAGNQSASELGKRVFLAFRDLPIDHKNLLIDILPDMILLYEARNCGIIGTELGTPDGIEALRKWNFNVAAWKRAFRWTPNIQYTDEVLNETDDWILENWDGIKNLGNDLALVLSVKKLAVERVAQAQWAADKDELNAAYNGYLEIYNEPEILEVMNNDKGEAEVLPKVRDVKPQAFTVRSEGDIKEEYFPRK